ncbi:MAG TPA: cyclic nucleotide-binding domain-containing protein [Usitatibacter sp.]|nr:cyclic nucleotide-binding domain-containing protein [Usitatibacter sp.]
MGERFDLLVNEAEPREYGDGEVIFRAWDMGAEMYVVLEGQVELTIDSRVLETLGPGEPFGEMALIDQAPRTASATAKGPCKLAVIPERRFLFLVQQRPEFALHIMKVMADRLRSMNRRV